MRLTLQGIRERAKWEKAGFVLPRFDIDAVKAQTARTPTWVHFGAGNIFRAFPAVCLQKLLENGIESTGVIVAEGFDYEIIDTVFAPHDNLSLAVTLRANGAIDKTVVASMVEALKADAGHPDFGRLIEVFRSPSLMMASFTITEKGYDLRRENAYPPDVAHDLHAGPGAPRSSMGKVAALLHERFTADRLPLAMVSMDNCSHNGDRLHRAVRVFASAWVDAGHADKAFLCYVDDPSSVSFPLTMIDKITPRPDAGVRSLLIESGFEDAAPVTTAKNTHTAPYVNAEETEYLVIEDLFPNGRLALDKAGILYADRATVDKIEKMKVCVCLNPLHTALAVFGCLLSHTKISDAMRDADLRRLVERLGYDEGLPTVADPGIVNPRDFLARCLDFRFPNPFMPDTPQRIACDTSLKLPIRFGETIKAYGSIPGLNIENIVCIPLVFAGWCRYLLGVNDDGEAFERSPDPKLPELDRHVADIRLGDTGSFHDRLLPILSDASLFGVNLYDSGLGERVETMFAEMTAEPGAVRTALHKHVWGP